MFHLKVGVSNALWSLQSYLYSAEKKNPSSRTGLTQTTQCTIYHVTDLCACHAKGAGPHPSKWFLQDPALTRELPAKLEEFLWCRGCSWKLLIIKTRLRTKPIAQIPDEHGRSPDVSQYLRLSDCWLSQDVPLLQHPTSTAYCLPFLRDSCDPTASPNWDKPTSPAEGKNGLVPFTAVEQLPRACSRGKQDPTETWNKHISSVAALDWGDTAV